MNKQLMDHSGLGKSKPPTTDHFSHPVVGFHIIDRGGTSKLNIMNDYEIILSLEGILYTEVSK